MTVLGKVEFAGSPRNRAAMFDRVQEFTVFDALQKTSADTRYFLSAGIQTVHQIVQSPAINAAMALESLQRGDLIIQLAENLTSDVTSRQNREYLE